MKPKMPNKLAVVGLGYVGLPVAVAFAEIGIETVGYDIDASRINELSLGNDRTKEIEAARLQNITNLTFTDDCGLLSDCTTYIVTVPTPINANKQPDLTPLQDATKKIGTVLKNGDIVVYESTVYPGATEDVCVPILEHISELTFGQDFHVGYSPERINPGDKDHTLETITKIVSGSSKETLNVLSGLYGRVVKAGIHEAPSIKVAEAAKVIENTQRDLNIALMNELALIFDRLDICTGDVLAAAETKWNFLKFSPGLVGGHCIGVDPFYLTAKSVEVGYHPEVVLAGRRTNDSIAAFVAQKALKMLGQNGCHPKNSKIGIYGITFKENVPDIRNSKVPDVVYELRQFGVEPLVFDPLADAKEVRQEYGISLCEQGDFRELDLIVLAVPHDELLSADSNSITGLMSAKGQLIDLKSVCLEQRRGDENYWSL